MYRSGFIFQVQACHAVEDVADSVGKVAEEGWIEEDEREQQDMEGPVDLEAVLHGDAEDTPEADDTNILFLRP